MPLSEEELRALEQMERALADEDPKFASTLRGTTFRRHARRRAIVAGVAFLVGIGMLLGGAVMSQPIVGVIGFVIMLGSAMIGLSSLRGGDVAAPTQARETAFDGFGVVDGGRNGRPRRSGVNDASFMDRMEERWRRRRDQGY